MPSWRQGVPPPSCIIHLPYIKTTHGKLLFSENIVQKPGLDKKSLDSHCKSDVCLSKLFRGKDTDLRAGGQDVQLLFNQLRAVNEKAHIQV